MLDAAIGRDPSPPTVARALPVLIILAVASVGTERELKDKGLLARAFLLAGRFPEAEALQREVIAQAERQGELRIALAGAGDLVTLLMSSGRLAEALDAAMQQIELSARAGIGPWTRLLVHAQRLQILNALGRPGEVLEEVERLRAEMKHLLAEAGPDDPAEPWNVREVLFDTGRVAAFRLGHWQKALQFNAQCAAVTRSRGADAVEVARVRFNDQGPLIELGLLPEARELLEDCRRVFEAAGDIAALGKTLGALADLAFDEGDPVEAAEFGRLALRYAYRAGEPEACAVRHATFALYARRTGSSADEVLGHHLAAAVLHFQTGSGHLATSIRNLALAALLETPPSFEQVVARVEETEGVRFQALFDAVPRRAPDGDSAIIAVSEMVAEAKARIEVERAESEALRQRLSGLSTDLAEAFAARDTARTGAALAALPPERRQEAVALLAEGGFRQGPAAP